MSTENKQVLAMYDVRGIQKYIFHTPKVKDAIGASYIVENIIANALKYAVKQLESKCKNVELKWCSKDGTYVYKENNNMDVQVLYIGGGNAYVLYRDRELCVEINKKMAKYTIQETYSLQLAVAFVNKTSNYITDYNAVMDEMKKEKANMIVSKPLGTLPIAKMDEEVISIERRRKLIAEHKKRKDVESSLKEFDTYAIERGKNRGIAVVHIDGNNMGLRIRKQLEGIENYTDAVNKMRQISFNINKSYKDVFEEMEKQYRQDDKPRVLEILVAGDDITYVCNSQIALNTVRYYVQEIAKRTMNGSTDEVSLKEYGFSVCAGIAYIGSHFPFKDAYEVAEACCDSAKSVAKREENILDGNVGNWVDYQIVKSIHAKNLENIRKDLTTGSGENLTRRPYYIATDNHNLGSMVKGASLEQLLDYIQYFQNDKLPSSLKIQLRNTYFLGEAQVKILAIFLESRNHKMPDDTYEMYIDMDKKSIAKWYDALELMRYVTVEEKQDGELQT